MKKRIAFSLLLLCLVIFYKSQSSVFTYTLTTVPAACKPGTAHMVVSGGTGPVSINWSNGGTGIWQTDLDSGLYSVVIADTTGNDSLIYFHIDLHHCPIVVSQAFSPNGDGINDYWICGVQNYSEFLIEVFNRWGQKVHEAKNEFTKWDGKSFGLPVPDGTYYYIVEYTDPNYGKQMDKGSITIIR